MLAELTFPRALHILQNMRDRDRREAYGLRWPEHRNPLLIAHELTALSVEKTAILADDGEPVAAIGGIMIRPGVASAYFVATDRWPVGPRGQAVRWVRVVLCGTMRAIGVRRMEAEAMVEVEETRFLRAVGFEPEGPVLRFYGAGGEDYRRWVWLDGDGADDVLGDEWRGIPAGV